MKDLDEAELACLRKIARGRTDGISPCAAHILGHLMEAGLVERAPHIWLPVQLVRISYRLTAAGEAVLHGR